MKRKLLATFEILGILIIGWTLTKTLINVLNVPPLQAYLDEAIISDTPDFIYLAKIGFITLLVQFLCLMIPASLLTKYLHNESIKALGFASRNKTLKDNAFNGIALFCLLGVPMKILLIINQYYDLGSEPAYWELFNKQWNIGFWLFMAVGSFLVIPIFEEIFYRGYIQFRFEMEFSFTSVFLVSLVFVSSHFQYYILDIFNIGMLLVLFILSIGMAFSRSISKSLTGAIIIHSLMNIPTKLPFDYIVLAFMVFGIIVLRKRIKIMGYEFLYRFRSFKLSLEMFILIIILVFALGMNYLPGLTLVLFILLFLVSLTIQIANKVNDLKAKSPPK